MADAPLLYDRYRIVRKLGSGAFATVYLADDLKMGRPVAVKMVEHATDVEDRVAREAQAAAKLSHHHILTEVDRFVEFYLFGKDFTILPLAPEFKGLMFSIQCAETCIHNFFHIILTRS